MGGGQNWARTHSENISGQNYTRLPHRVDQDGVRCGRNSPWGFELEVLAECYRQTAYFQAINGFWPLFHGRNSCFTAVATFYEDNVSQKEATVNRVVEALLPATHAALSVDGRRGRRGWTERVFPYICISGQP